MNPPCKTLVLVLALTAAHTAPAADIPAAASHPLDLTPIAAGTTSRERLSDAQVQTRIDATLQADGSVLLHCEHKHAESARAPRRLEQEQ